MKCNATAIILVTVLVLLLTMTEVSSAPQTISIKSVVTVTGILPQVNETSISGYVLNSTNKTGMPNWNIQLFGLTKNYKTINKITSTNFNGFYKFNNLPEGRYTLILKLKAGYIPTEMTSLRLNLKINQKSENNNFTVRIVKRSPFWRWNLW